MSTRSKSHLLLLLTILNNFGDFPYEWPGPHTVKAQNEKLFVPADFIESFPKFSCPTRVAVRSCECECVQYIYNLVVFVQGQSFLRTQLSTNVKTCRTLSHLLDGMIVIIMRMEMVDVLLRWNKKLLILCKF